MSLKCATINIKIDVLSEDVRSALGAARHRFVNDLNLVRGLLGLVRRRVDDKNAAELIEGTRERIRAIGLAYSVAWSDGVASSPRTRLDPGPFVRALVGELVSERSPRASKIQLDIEVSDVRLSFDETVAVGLLTRELVSNGLDHAFPDERSGVLEVRLRRTPEGTATLSVSDDGIGMPSDVGTRRRRKLGLDVAGMLAEQLAGELELEQRRNGGVACTVRFQLTE